MNVKFKHCLYDGIDKKVMPKLFTRIGCHFMIMICVQTAIKGLPPVYVALSSNISPLLITVSSYFFFKKIIPKLDILVLIISFIGVAILISGKPEKTATGIEVEANEVSKS